MATATLRNGRNGVHDPAMSHAANKTKIERYGWTLADEPGRFEMIDKRQLHVDEEYQRAQTVGKVQAMAADWSWVACGCLTVAKRDRKLYVMDGGHRHAAAMRRADIAELPCMVHDVQGIADEAAGFLKSNTLRKPVSAVAKFKAQIMVGEPVALAVKAMTDAAGYEVRDHTQGKVLKCITSMMFYSRTNQAALDAVWPIVIEASDSQFIHERLLGGLWYIEAKSEVSGVSLTRQPWRGRVLRLGRQGLIDAANRAAAYYATGGPRVWASGIVEALNKGLQHRLSLTGETE